MQLTASQKSAAQAIVNIFETGSIRGNYSDVTLLPGDTGRLTYGRSQTTLASGNLFLLMQDYCGRSDGALSAAFKPYLPSIEACDGSLNHDMTFRGLLKDAGNDPVMQDVQDAFFDRVYWDPAMRSADTLGAQSALGAAVVYDSTVHGSWARVRDLTRKQFGELRDIGEDNWISHYVDTRREWLATYPNPLLHKTVYRMDAFRAIIQTGNWKLALPLNVCGSTITPDSLANTVPVKVPAEGVPRRLLRLKAPPTTGPDVSWLQERLTLAGIRVVASGTFDAPTDAAVRAFQEAHDLKADGVVGSVTRSALEDIPVIAPTPSQTLAQTEPMPAVPQLQAAVVPSQVAGVTPGAPAGGDAVADIKQHVTTAVQTGVTTIQKTITEKHQQLVTSDAPVAKKKPAKAARPAAAVTDELRTVVTSMSPSGRPVIAGVLSAVILLFTEIRDAIAWVAGGLAKTGVVGNFIPPLPALPQSTADIARFLSGSYNYLHALAGSIPNEWMFRIRIVAIVLICYALYRLRSAHINLSKLQQRFEEAQQDLAEAQQVKQDIEKVAQSVK